MRRRIGPGARHQRLGENGSSIFPFDSIEEAVDAASSGDTIIVRRGLYRGSCTMNFVIDKDLTIIGAGNCGETVMDGEGVRRAFSVDPGVTLRVENITFRDCFGGTGGTISGGAVFANTADVTFSECCFENCTTLSDGGGVFVLSGSGTYEDCVFESCSADGEGGAIVQAGGTLTVSGGSFGENHADRGGAIRSSRTTTISDAFFVSNSADSDGGVMLFESGSNVMITSCEIGSVGPFDNTAGTNGGAISANNAVVSILGTTILNSTATRLGGLIYMANGSEVTIDGSTLRYGTGTLGGGAIYNDASSLVMTDSFVRDNNSGLWRGGAIRNATGATCEATLTEFTDNTAGREGGAIYTQSSVANLTECSFDRNMAETEGGGALRYEDGASGVIDTCTFDDNESLVLDGGAVSSSGGSMLEIRDSTFTMNVAETDGGAISSYDQSHLSISGSTCHNNTADTGIGGGVASRDSASETLLRDTNLIGNYAPNGVGTDGSGGGVASVNGDLRIEGGQISGNQAGVVGGGALCDTGALTIDGTEILDNVAALQGGGVFSFRCPTTEISGANIVGNGVSVGFGEGGGVFVEESVLTMQSTILRANRALDGGGLFTRNVDVTVREGQFRGNLGEFSSGGAHHTADLPLPVRYRWTRFVQNATALGTGGAVTVDQDAVFHNCGFFGNDSYDIGGAICSASAGSISLDVVGCLFSCNTTEIFGGAIYANHTGGMSIVNSTFSANETQDPTVGLGGGVYTENASTTIDNSIFFENLDSTGNTYTAQIYRVAGTIAVDNSCFTDPACPPPADLRSPYGTGPGTNICADPLFVDADGADDTCGTDDDDLSLMEGSACIDAACNDALPTDALDVDFDEDTGERFPLDVVGNDRVVDDPCADDNVDCTPAETPVVDMGAIEALPCDGSCPADLDEDGDVDGDDFFLYLDAFAAGDADVCDLDMDGDCDSDDFFLYLDLFAMGC
ncbi:MAG: hypothetical protein H6811_10625 [Phycisphaeraceae bacterium]|nr:hypothetical protein [Phycisphaeraceae bacterium]